MYSDSEVQELKGSGFGEISTLAKIVLKAAVHNSLQTACDSKADRLPDIKNSDNARSELNTLGDDH